MSTIGNVSSPPAPDAQTVSQPPAERPERRPEEAEVKQPETPEETVPGSGTIDQQV